MKGHVISIKYYTLYTKENVLIPPQQGLMIQDVLMKQVTIKVGVVLSFAPWQQKNAAWLDTCSSCASARTQQQTRFAP